MPEADDDVPVQLVEERAQRIVLLVQSRRVKVQHVVRVLVVREDGRGKPQRVLLGPIVGDPWDKGHGEHLVPMGPAPYLAS